MIEVETVSPPLLIEDAETIAWDDEADVVVVGYGGTGACAALQAHESGAKVLIVDRFEGGGATAYSGGIIYAGGTTIQRQAGFNDNADAMYDYLAMEAGDVVRPETLRRYCDESSQNLDWLIGHGVPYASDYYGEKTIYPPDGKYLYYSGNERVPDYAARATPAPRGHRPVGSGMSGNVYFAALAKAISANGIPVRTHTQVTRLITDRAGRVIGVEARVIAEAARPRHKALYDKVVPMLPFKGESSERAIAAAKVLEAQNATPVRIRARRGVVLSTGGFAFNLPLLHRHQPFFADNYKALMRLGSMGCDGSGIGLGQSVGGAVDRMDSVYAARNIAPPNALLGGILVNRNGERFIDEECYSGFLGSAIVKQPDGAAWLILPGRSFRTAIRQAFSSGMLFFKYYGVPALLNFLLGGTRRAASLKRLADKCDIPSAALIEAVEAHDHALATGQADPFGKTAENTVPFGNGPFYAINMAIPNIYAFTYLFTLGGLTVDEATGGVTRGDGRVIDGLYAAGRAAVGLCSNGYISGLSIGDGMFSGRRAGRAAAHRVPITRSFVDS